MRGISKLTKKSIAFFMVLSIVFMLTFTTSSHNGSTGGVSWGNQSSVRFGPLHLRTVSSTHIFHYRIVPCNRMTNTIINNAVAGGNLWAPEVRFGRNDSVPFGEVKFVNASVFDFSNDPAGALRRPSTDGHVSSFEIQLNRGVTDNSVFTPKLFAHEFGHVIGLADLGDPDDRTGETAAVKGQTRGSIMWYRIDTIVTAPTIRDKTAARIITGQFACTHSNSGVIFHPHKGPAQSNGQRFNSHQYRQLNT